MVSNIVSYVTFAINKLAQIGKILTTVMLDFVKPHSYVSACSSSSNASTQLA